MSEFSEKRRIPRGCFRVPNAHSTRIFWTPSRGGHTIVAVTPLQEAVSINIHVE
jgi:hypothetical protein